MKIPLTADEKRIIETAAEADSEKPVTWVRAMILKVAQKKQR